MDQSVATIKKRFHLGGDAEDIVRTDQNKTVTSEQLVFDALIVVLEMTNTCFMAGIASDTWLNAQGLQ